MLHSRVAAFAIMLLIFFSAFGITGGGIDHNEETRGENPPVTNDPPWLLDVNVTDDISLESQVEPDMVVDDMGIIHVGWIDRRSGVWRVRYARSLDGGLSFEPSIEMDDPTHPETGDPVLTFANSVLYYAWISFDRILFRSDTVMRRSLDYGVTWGPLVKVSDSPDTVFTDKPWITAKGNTVYAVYVDFDVTTQLRFAKSIDQGISFEPSVQVNNIITGNRNGACIDIGPNDEIYVSWWDSGGITGQGIFFSKSLNGGLAFTPSTKVGSTPWGSPGPYRAGPITSLAVGPEGYIYITWADFTTVDWDVMLTASLDNGTSFSPPLRVNDDLTSEIQFMPWVDVDPYGKVHVAWYDNRTQQLEIMYANSTTFGMSMGPNIRVSDVSFLGADWFIGDYIPLFADEWTNVHVVWCDSRNGDNDIYYSQLPGPGIPGPPPAPVPFVSARLEGASFQDVNITWTLSPDDGAGQHSVVQYIILQSNAYNRSGIGYTWLADVPAGTDYFVASGMGHGDPQNLFFIVQAKDTWGQGNNSAEQAGKFVRQLNRGWNLISPPLVQEDPTISVVLQTVPYRCVRQYSNGNASDPWKQYCPFKRYGEISVFGVDTVLWIDVTQTSNWTTAGRVLKQHTVQMKEGWTLIGLPAFSGYDIARLKAETGVLRIEGFLESALPYHLYVMMDAEPLQAGYGYWVRATAETFWTVENL